MSVIAPKLSLLSFCSGTPEIGTLSRPLTVDSGVNAPVSIAAVAVTTLKLDPGAYPNWVARFTSGRPGATSARRR